MWLNLFLVACVYLFLPIEYAVMRNNTVPKNNLILSVTLPPEAREDPEVGRICADFRRKLLWACGLLTLVLVPAVFLPWMSVCTTVALVWLLAALVVPVWVYGRGFAAMKALKRRRGWQTASAGQTVVELGPVKLPRPVKTRWFVPPMVLSVLPVISCLADDWEPSWAVILLITAGSCLLVTAMSLLCYGLIFHQRADALDGDLDLTTALTRVRRYNWTKFWLLSAWLTAGYSLAVWLCLGSGFGYILWTSVYTVALLAAALATEFAARRAQQRLTQNRTRQPQVDEDDYWIWGQFYYNPNSTRLMINERVGMGISMNFARPGAKALAVFCAVLLLAMPLFGVWLMAEELTPIRLTLEADAVVAAQVGEVCRVPLSEIEDARILDTLPACSRIWGTGMENLLKGSFDVAGFGVCQLCLNPQSGPYLLLDTAHETYLLGGPGVEALWTALAER